MQDEPKTEETETEETEETQVEETETEVEPVHVNVMLRPVEVGVTVPKPDGEGEQP